MGTVINSLIGLFFFGAVQHICGPERGSGALAGKKTSGLKAQEQICMKLETNFQKMGEQKSKIESIEKGQYTIMKEFQDDIGDLREQMKQ